MGPRRSSRNKKVEEKEENELKTNTTKIKMDEDSNSNDSKVSNANLPETLNLSEDGNSSDSSVENYLKPANEINLNSSFFDLKIEPSVKLKRKISTVDRLSDTSDSDLEDTEIKNEANNVEIKIEGATAFQEQEDFNKRIEDVKNAVENYKNKQLKQEKNMGIKHLLSVGEKRFDTTTASFESYMSDSSTDNEMDWEQIDEKLTEATEKIPREGVQITVELPMLQRKKKEKDDYMMQMKRRLNRIKKENQVYMHKVHLLCWIAHGNYVNTILNNENLLGLCLSLIPSENCYPPQRADIKYLEMILRWYGRVIKLVEKPITKVPTVSLEKILTIQLKNKEVNCKKNYVLLFICILRTLGLQCRLVLSLRCVPLRPSSSELCSLSTKKDNSVKKESEKASTSKNETKKASSKTEVNKKSKSTSVDLKNVKKESEVPKKGSEVSKNASVDKKNIKKDLEMSRKSSEISENASGEGKNVKKVLEVSKKALESSRKTSNKGEMAKSPIKNSEKIKTTKNDLNLETKEKNLKLPLQLEKKEKITRSRSAGTKSEKSSEKLEKSEIPETSVKKRSAKNSTEDKNEEKITRSRSADTKTELKSKKSELLERTPDKKLCVKNNTEGESRAKIKSSSEDLRSRNTSPDKKSSGKSLRSQNKTLTDDEPVASTSKSKPSLNKLKVIKRNSSEEDFHPRKSFSSPEKSILPKNDVRNDIINLIKGSLSEQKIALRHRQRKPVDDSSDSDYHPEPNKKSKTDSGDEFKKKKVNTKVKQRIKPKSVLLKEEEAKKKKKVDSRVLSTDDEDDSKKKEKAGNDVWCEVFLEAEEKWISVDVVRCQVHCVKELHSRASTPISYILSWNNNLSVKDVTSRYCPHMNTVTRKLRTDPTWWKESLKPYEGVKTARDREEDEDLARQQLDQPLPKTIGEYKNHPLYALKRHLLKFEAIYPPDALTLGFVRNEAVYARECIHTLHSREIWMKHAKVVKLGEKPYKIVKARPKYDRSTGSTITDQPLEIFGIWQVEDYIPPTAQNGVVPRNAFGNVELFKPCMLPGGTVHLQLPGLNKISRRLQIDCAPALVGFDFHSGGTHPVFDGYIVCEEFKEQLIQAWEEEQEEIVKREQEKIEKRVYDNWKKLIKGLLIREKLMAKYEFESLGGGKGKKKNKGPRFIAKKRRVVSGSESSS